MTFSEFTKQKRVRIGFSQNQVAQVLGFAHRSNVHRLETGKLEWKLRDMLKLANMFGVTPSDLLKEFELINK